MHVRLSDLDKEIVCNVIRKSISYSEILNKLNLSIIPRNRKDLKTFIKDNNICIDHFNFYLRRKKYKLVEKKCTECGKLFINSQSGKQSKKTCSIKCSNIYFSKKRMTEKTKEKIRQSLIAKSGDCRKGTCQICKKPYKKKRKTQRFCSNACAAVHRAGNPEYRKKISNAQKRLVESGKHKGWKSRNILSYPEKYFIYRLDQENLNYKVNFPLSKQKLGEKSSSCYFLDFYFEENKVNLEIDGRQHEFPDRKLSDKHRDELLTDYGITVFRIKWINPSSFEDKERLDSQFQQFLTLIK